MTRLHSDGTEIEIVWQAISRSGARSVALVSAEPGEGTSMLAAALAARSSLATPGQSALAVDLNVLEPRLAHEFSLSGVRGEVVNVPGSRVSVLSGHRTHWADWREPAPLAAQVAEWTRGWSFVVLDTAPILVAGSQPVRGEVAAAAADAAILVTLAGRTAARRVAEARQRLEGVGARLIGIVMNDAQNPAPVEEIKQRIAALTRCLPRRPWRKEGFRPPLGMPGDAGWQES